MSFVLLTPQTVIAIHDAVLNPGELPGMALNKSLDGALARVENRLVYGLASDLFEVAALYAMAIAQGHCFNDANKRTAFQAMDTFLDLNGVQIDWAVEVVGPRIIALAQGQTDEVAFADWLRDLAGRPPRDVPHDLPRGRNRPINTGPAPAL